MITIVISNELHGELKGLKTHDRQSYNEVIQILYDEKMEDL